MPGDKIAEKIVQIDVSDLEFPMIAIYANPKDYPGKYVARIFDLDKPTNTILLKDTLEELQNHIAESTTLSFFCRGAGDVPELVGVWL